jgi:hypothetical protein
MHRFFILVVAGTTISAAAFADDHTHRLHGTYALTGMSFCIRVAASTGFNPDFTPKAGPVKFFTYTVDGVTVYHADGTGTLRARAYSVDTGGGETSDDSYQFTYTTGRDGKLTVKAVPGTFTDTILTGPIAGLTQVVDIPDASASIDQGARIITFRGRAAPVVQMVNRSDGRQFAQICNGSRVEIRLNDDDDDDDDR